MDIVDVLAPDCTKCAVQGSSKKKILEYISCLAATHCSELTDHQILESLLTREKLGSTGIGKGIAIPHGKLANTEKIIAVFITTESGIQFDAIDNQPVDIFFALLVPEDQCQAHLQTLSKIATFLSDKQRCKQIRQAGSDQELFTLISEG